MPFLSSWIEDFFAFVGFPTPTPLFRVFPICVQKSLAMSYFLIEGRCIFFFFFLWQTCAFYWKEQVIEKRAQVSVTQLSISKLRSSCSKANI